MTGYPTARAVSRSAGVDRVVVGGKDITWFRAESEANPSPTAVPDYTLTEPHGYGDSGPLVIPRTDVYFEQLGTGDLSWCRKGATVLYQRVLPGGTVVTDYRGVVLAIRAARQEITLDVGGALASRAELIDRQQPVVRLVKDLGHWASLALAEVGMALAPGPIGPATGLRYPDQGGMTLLAWLEQLGTLSQDRNGNQRAIMPAPWGSTSWRFDVKDSTTKDLTIYADGDRIKLDLVDDAAEQPNVFYGSGVAPNGVRWKNARYPGILQGPAAPYPFTDDRNFGIGTTDSDTDTGDGITVLGIKLVSMGYMDIGEGTPGLYSQDMYDAVEELKRDASLSANGTMTPNAWAALWNISATGYSNAGAQAFPLVWSPKVRKWNYSSNGSIIGRNAAFDPQALRVDQTSDFGAGVSKKQAINYVRGRANRAVAKNWAGTITLTQGVGAFTGEHDGGDAATLTAADMMPARNIRPGMNVWIPHFDGGTLFHIAGVSINTSGRTATLTVDTQARNLLEVKALLERNRESRRDIRREWYAANRANRSTSGQMVSRDEHFGIQDRDVRLQGGQWNTVQVIIGQSGTVNRTHIQLVDDEAEFCYAVIRGDWSAGRVARTIGNPFPVSKTTGEGAFDQPRVQKLLEDKTILYAAGNEKQPCGYGHRKKFGDNDKPTGAPLTGSVYDDSTWSYLSAGERLPIVTIAIYPDRDCTLKAGPILDALQDDVT